MKKTIITCASLALTLGLMTPVAQAAPAPAAAPSPTECKALEVLGYGIMGRAMRDSQLVPQFTVSQFRGRLMDKSENQIASFLGNRYAGMLGSAKFAKETADTALACGLVRKDPERVNTSSSEIGNVITAVLGITLPR